MILLSLKVICNYKTLIISFIKVIVIDVSTLMVIVHGLIGLRLPSPPYTLNLYKTLINTLKLQKTLLLIRTHVTSPVGGNLPQSNQFLLHVLHYKLAHNSFIFYPILNFKIVYYVNAHCLQVLLNKYFP